MPTLSGRKALVAGIRPDEYMERDGGYLYDARNLRPDVHAMKPFYALTQPWTNGAITAIGAKSHPFPMFIKGREVELLCYETHVAAVSYSAGTLTEISFKNANDLSGGTAFTIPSGGGVWQFIDLGQTWMLFNGACVLFKFGASPYYWGSSAVTIKTGCAFKYRRAFLGGFNPSDMYALVDWPSILGGAANAPEELQALLDTNGFGANYVWWSSWGAADLFWLYLRNFMIYASMGSVPNTGFTDADPYYRELATLNESGYTPMPWDGDVKCVKEFNDGAIVYGALGGSSSAPGGVTGLIPISGSNGRGFGLRPVEDFPDGLGIADRGAVAGNRLIHAFIAEDGDLWVIANYKAQRIGHREIFASFLGHKITIAYDQSRRDFWISDGTACYVRTPTGLSKAPWMPTSIHFAGAIRQAVYFDDASPDEVLIVYDKETVPGGRPAVIEYLKFEGKASATYPVQLALDYRINNQVTWTRTSFKNADTDGVARFDVLALEYRRVLKCANKSGITVDDVIVSIGDGPIQLSGWPASSASASTE